MECFIPFLLVIAAAFQVTERQEVVAVQLAGLIEEEIKQILKISKTLDENLCANTQTKKWSLFCHNYPSTTKRKNCVTL